MRAPRKKGNASSFVPDDPVPYLLVRGLSHVQDLSSQREHSVAIAPDDSQSRDGQRLGGVALGEDQSALRGVFSTCNTKNGQIGHFCVYRCIAFWKTSFFCDGLTEQP